MPDRPARECQTMDELRAEIDRLDRALIALLAERQSYIERAAEIKGDRGAVRDEGRIADVLDKVAAEARRRGLEPAVAEAVWRAMMEGFIAYEFVRFDARRA